MPEEIFIITGLAIAAGTFYALVKAILGYLAIRHRPATPAAPSLSHRELEALIEGAVERATASLHERLDMLEMHALAPPAEAKKRFEEAEAPQLSSARHPA